MLITRVVFGQDHLFHQERIGWHGSCVYDDQSKDVWVSITFIPGRNTYMLALSVNSELFTYWGSHDNVLAYLQNALLIHLGVAYARNVEFLNEPMMNQVYNRIYDEGIEDE